MGNTPWTFGWQRLVCKHIKANGIKFVSRSFSLNRIGCNFGIRSVGQPGTISLLFERDIAIARDTWFDQKLSLDWVLVGLNYLLLDMFLPNWQCLDNS